MKSMYNTCALITLFFSSSVFSFVSKKIQEEVISKVINNTKESIQYAESTKRELDSDKKYVQSLYNIIQALEQNTDEIFAEIENTGTSATLIKKAPLRKTTGIAKNATALNTIWLIKFYLKDITTHDNSKQNFLTKNSPKETELDQFLKWVNK